MVLFCLRVMWFVFFLLMRTAVRIGKLLYALLSWQGWSLGGALGTARLRPHGKCCERESEEDVDQSSAG
ncbi:hypothetical protein BCCGELA001_30315 [Bradyrhizobium sp. CCGE-LA001]|nr:hypothetical protein BCCGELA001_30315 [Bradyrhizobium sp. CCGE-LA001]